MDGYWETKLIVLLLAVIALGLLCVLAYFLRDRITGVTISRTGLQMHTNDVSVWSKIVDKIERIDASTCKSIRKATTRLMIIDPEKYGMSAEVMLMIREANMPLVYAAYENHHTREIAADGGEMYLADKAHDISEAVQMGRKHFPELTDEVAADHARRWVKKILAPNLRKACLEKNGILRTAESPREGKQDHQGRLDQMFT